MERPQIPAGRLLVGLFGGIEQVTKRDGTRMDGMWEVTVIEERPDRGWKHTATFFDTDKDGEVSRMRRSLDTVLPQEGDLVAVRIRTRGSLSNDKVYANDTAVNVQVLHRPGQRQ